MGSGVKKYGRNMDVNNKSPVVAGDFNIVNREIQALPLR
jgi:hypothetical protein